MVRGEASWYGETTGAGGQLARGRAGGGEGGGGGGTGIHPLHFNTQAYEDAQVEM